MNLACVNQIAKAVLYEGYMLYPYRPSSVKNRQRWNFGVVYPQAYSEAHDGEEACTMHTECLICGDAAARLSVIPRFLHLQIRSASPDASSTSLPDGWQEAVEREVAPPAVSLADLLRQPVSHSFAIPSGVQVRSGAVELRHEAIEGVVEISAAKVGDNIFKVVIHVTNTSPIAVEPGNRDAILMHSLVSTHTVLGIDGAEFISLLEPPAALQELASNCRNVGAWPVLVGEPGQCDTMLASPIILYDYPQIAPESPGDLFDGTEIDEILSLRIMTLTDDEKREIRQSDARAREILERTESMPVEQFMKMHGAMRALTPRALAPLKGENS
jgi:hypothetical protein